MATSAKMPPICLGKNWIWLCKDKVFAASPEILRRGFFLLSRWHASPRCESQKAGLYRFAPKCRWCPNVVCNVFKDNVFMPTRSKLQAQFPSSSHRQQKDSAASSKFHDHSSFTIHARCFSGAQNSITVLFRLFFKIFQCALFHFYLKNSNLLLYLFFIDCFSKSYRYNCNT